MLRSVGCSHVILGHSERRQYFGETDASVNGKVLKAMAEGLVPILCIGETLEERKAGRVEEVVRTQLLGGLEGVSLNDPSELVVAYEPVWAIGTIAVPRCAGGRREMSLPPRTIEPSLTASCPAIIRNVVDFPQPDGPSRQT